MTTTMSKPIKSFEFFFFVNGQTKSGVILLESILVPKFRAIALLKAKSTKIKANLETFFPGRA